MPEIEELHTLLSARIPVQGPAGVVHGDYRLDNCVVSSDGSQVLAVLDWELCTLGDPLADLGQLLTYWPGPGERSSLGSAPTRAPGFATRDELIGRYSASTGRDLSQLGFYVAFAYWKLACILEGVYARYVGGAMGDDGFDSSIYPDTIAWLASQSKEAAMSLGG
jgi:aminoglycoside phosphotransferase (APT) family kinase protein